MSKAPIKFGDCCFDKLSFITGCKLAIERPIGVLGDHLQKLRFRTKTNFGLKILHFSDLHGADYSSKNLLDKIDKISVKIDLIFMTGDMGLNDSSLNNLIEFTHYLKAKFPKATIFMVPGNHDYFSGIPSLRQWFDPTANLDAWEKSCNQGDCHVLRNQQFTAIFNNVSIDILGLDDLLAYYPTIDAAHQKREDVILDFQSKTASLKIIITHRPLTSLETELCQQLGVNLVFCGHNHGGQICLPTFLSRKKPNKTSGSQSQGCLSPEGFFPYYDHGLFTHNSFQVIVSAGLSNTMYLPKSFSDFIIVQC